MAEIADAAAAMLFTADELEALRVALMTAHYSAADEERALAERLRLGHYEDEAHRRTIEIGRVEAALRMMRYLLLAERVMAAPPESPTRPTDQAL